MRVRETAINVSGTHGRLRLRAVVTGDLAATSSENGRGWNVTHVPTGRRFPASFLTRRDAVACARELEGAFNWDEIASHAVLGVPVPFETREAIRAVLVKHRGQVSILFAAPPQLRGEVR